MKANQKDRKEFIQNRSGFVFIIPLTMVLIVGFSLLAVGAYVVGALGSALEDTYQDNTASGSANTTTWNNRTGVTTAHQTIVTLPSEAYSFNNAISKFYISANGSALDYDLVVNGQEVNTSSNMSQNTAYNVTFAYLLTNNSINDSDTSITFDWNITSDDGVGNAFVRYSVASYFVSSDYRSNNENKTIILIGNVTDGFSDVVDVEVVVIIITVLSMVLITIMAIESRKSLF